MPRTLLQLRQGTIRALGGRYFFGTADASGNLATLLRAAALQRYPDGYFTGLWTLMTSGATSGEIVRNTVFTSANGDIVPDPDFSEAPTSDGFEVLPVDPTDLAATINRVMRLLFPRVFRTLYLEGYVSGSPIIDGGFEDWDSSTSLRYYTATTVTLSRQTSSPQGDFFCRIASGATGSLAPSAESMAHYNSMAGTTVTLYAFVRTSTASNTRLRMVDSAGTNSTGAYHTGGGQWELLSVEHTFSAADAVGIFGRFVPTILVDDGTTQTDASHWWIEAAPVTQELILPQIVERGPVSVYAAHMRQRENPQHYGWVPVDTEVSVEDPLFIASNTFATGASLTRVRLNIPSGRPLLIVARIPMPDLSADTDVAYVDELTGTLVETEAAIQLLKSNIGLHAADENRTVREIQEDLEDQRDDIVTQLKKRQPAVTLPLD